MKKLYDKSKIWFAVTWIIAYCVLMSVGDALSAWVGVEKSVTLAIGILLSFTLLLFFNKYGLFSEYGLCSAKTSARSMLYYAPLFIMLSANFWHGVTLNYSALSTVLYILAMLCVGFCEEVIFRGLLFEAIRKDNTLVAIIVSSVTFGIGHIINLINGSGADLFANLLQVVYATAAGFMFVMMYYKSKSLLACIGAHSVFNALSAFANEASLTNETRILTALLLTVVTGSYALYLALSMRQKAKDKKIDDSEKSDV
ncbi:MAG: CPBP family intramembrane metalloprotease [Clostridia bacterium]|nr:CPBP family intramembrane metalloprotease [Clostridia bacterium]